MSRQLNRRCVKGPNPWRWAQYLYLWMMVGVLSACSLPPLGQRSVTEAMLSDQTEDTLLGKGLAAQRQASPGMSGVGTLADPLGAFAARIQLIAAAQRSVDVQYYIWRNDTTGRLLLQALREAAQRQVRVRLLLDDNGVSGMDEVLSLLNNEPNIEVRLFNPFPTRTLKPLGFLFDFARLNRRMHNKSLTVDGQATIVGGRNIGDEYFGATQGMVFADLDVLVAGKVVDEVSRDFDRYWHSESAYPLERLVSTPNSRRLAALDNGLKGTLADPKARAYIEAVKSSRFIAQLQAGELVLSWVPVRMVSDDPAKVLGQAPRETLVLSRLNELLEQPGQSLDLVSPYFVPTEKGVEAFNTLARQGVRVRVLTNALEATDVAAVHAGYGKYRADLLKAGITLFELRRRPNPDVPREKAGIMGSSGSSLHAKTFTVDNRLVFVGSLNFDPRSAALNTELGFVIRSPKLARDVAAIFGSTVHEYAYQVKLDEQGDLYWLARDGDEVQRYTQEPNTSLWRRFYVWLLSLLPIESLL